MKFPGKNNPSEGSASAPKAAAPAPKPSPQPVQEDSSVANLNLPLIITLVAFIPVFICIILSIFGMNPLDMPSNSVQSRPSRTPRVASMQPTVQVQVPAAPATPTAPITQPEPEPAASVPDAAAEEGTFAKIWKDVSSFPGKVFKWFEGAKKSIIG